MEENQRIFSSNPVPGRGHSPAFGQLTEIVHATADVIISIDNSQKIGFVNDAVEALFGYKPKELIGSPLLVLIPPTYRSGHSRHVEGFKSGESATRLMAQRTAVFGMKKDGQMVPLEISILKHKRQGPLSLTAIIRDISERISHQNQKLESERRYRTILETRNRAVALLTPAGRIIDVNQAVVSIAGIPKQEILGSHIWQAPWWVGEERRQILRDFVENIGEGPSSAFVMERADPDGKRSKVELALKAMRLDTQEIDFLVVEWPEPGAGSETRDSVQNYKAHLDLAQRNARIGSWELEFPSENLKWSEETFRIYGQDPKGFIPSYAAMLAQIRPDSRQGVDQAIRQAIEAGNGFTIFYSVVQPNGAERMVQHIGKVLRSNEGKALLVLATVQDITETWLREKELSEALEKAEATSLAKSRFLANLAHELRTPLNAIIGFSEFMQTQEGGSDSGRSKEYSSYISSGGRRLLSVVNDMMLAMRLDAGMITVQLEQVEAGRMVRNVVQTQKAFMAEKGIAVEFDIPDSLTVFADEALLGQAVANVLHNAIKFGRQGGRVLVSASHDGDGVHFCVEDNGAGMSEGLIDEIFNPFYQMDADLNRHSEGIGLGLTITRAILNLHGGGIGVESSPLKGAKVTLSLPSQRIVSRV